MKRIFGTASLITSLVLFGIGGYRIWERTNPTRISLIPHMIPSRIGGQPDTLVIPTAHITLPIYPAYIRGTRWDQTTAGVSYLVQSPLPGIRGNSVIYGHNWPNLLGPLHLVKPGHKLFVRYGSKTIGFTVDYVSTVQASDISVIAPTQDARITIYTCTGFLDQGRLVVTALRDNPIL